jgi:hypothetical protein
MCKTPDLIFSCDLVYEKKKELPEGGRGIHQSCTRMATTGKIIGCDIRGLNPAPCDPIRT